MVQMPHKRSRPILAGGHMAELCGLLPAMASAPSNMQGHEARAEMGRCDSLHGSAGGDGREDPVVQLPMPRLQDVSRADVAA